MCEIDLEPCEVWTVTRPTAKKEHRCDCCEATIPPGARYHRTFSIFEGVKSTGKHCARCERDMASFAKAHDGARVTPEGFIDILDNCIWEGDESAPRWRAMLHRIRGRARATPSAVGLAGSDAKAPDPQGASGPTGP